MTGAARVEVWTGEAFHDEVRAWSTDRLAEHRLSPTGEWEQPHARPWSSAIRIGTDAGPVWFKVNGPGTRHEAALVRLVDECVPGLVPEVLAVDQDRGWSLSRDGGPVLRSVLSPEDCWPVWEGLVARYAAAQRTLAGERERALAVGVEDVSPAATPALARLVLTELSSLPADQGGLTAQEGDRLEAVLPDLEAWCAELAASGVPDSVQHDDLHSANVCWTGSVATARIIDWGDAVWATPLATMLGTLNSIAFHAGVYDGDHPRWTPEVLRVRDAYLEVYDDLVDRATLRRLLVLARRTGCVTKALSYRRALRGEPLETHADWEFPVREWLLGLLDEPDGSDRADGEA